MSLSVCSSELMCMQCIAMCAQLRAPVSVQYNACVCALQSSGVCSAQLACVLHSASVSAVQSCVCVCAAVHRLCACVAPEECVFYTRD